MEDPRVLEEDPLIRPREPKPVKPVYIHSSLPTRLTVLEEKNSERLVANESVDMRFLYDS